MRDNIIVSVIGQDQRWNIFIVQKIIIRWKILKCNCNTGIHLVNSYQIVTFTYEHNWITLQHCNPLHCLQNIYIQLHTRARNHISILYLIYLENFASCLVARFLYLRLCSTRKEFLLCNFLWVLQSTSSSFFADWLDISIYILIIADFRCRKSLQKQKDWSNLRIEREGNVHEHTFSQYLLNLITM